MTLTSPPLAFIRTLKTQPSCSSCQPGFPSGPSRFRCDHAVSRVFGLVRNGPVVESESRKEVA